MPSEKKKGTKAKKAALWAFVLGAIFVFWQRLPRPPSVPRELIGTWRTSDPRYADRSFEIGITIIDFGTGDGTVTTGFIQKVEAVPETGRTFYTISYLQDGHEEQCSFYYTSEREKTIYFKNQPSISWIKDKDS
jgi:hypothetical protein